MARSPSTGDQTDVRRFVMHVSGLLAILPTDSAGIIGGEDVGQRSE
jgi:hypothetical protein